MTQEELDALMADNQIDDILNQDSTQDMDKDTEENINQEDTKAQILDDCSSQITQDSTQTMPDNFRVSADAHWPPPPPTDDHKMVRQLDDVTRDSEEKATQVLDKLDGINALLDNAQEYANNTKGILEANLEIFDKLSSHFVHIESFNKQKEETKQALEDIQEVLTKLQNGQDSIMDIIDMMQYQDIHRQKIERVINVMRALAKYMNSLFESDIDDKNRVSSAVHIEGDKTENLMSDDDIEALINSFGKN